MGGRFATTVRACGACRRDYELFMRPATRQPRALPEVATSTVARDVGGRRKASTTDEHGLPAASVPTDWTWSTF
ncbi:hypothetical protein PYCC9005_004841 [Savitreella phatthalungensis]